MGLLSKWRDRRSIDLDDRSPQTGVKYKDLLVLDQLVEAGADMNAPRHVVYYLYFPDQERAADAAAEASSEGFDTDVRPPLPDDPDQWALVCDRHDYVLDLEIVRGNTDLFEGLAARHGGDYDGWEASVS